MRKPRLEPPPNYIPEKDWFLWYDAVREVEELLGEEEPISGSYAPISNDYEFISGSYGICGIDYEKH